MQPLVSVIIPVYNVRQYLCESLDSVITQKYKNLEVIIVDDGSTDGSGKICDQYQKKDKRVRVIHQENKGLSGARNAGLDIMHGDIVAFLDPDDAFLPDMIELLVRDMLKHNADISICGFYVCQPTKKLSSTYYDSIFTLENRCVNTNEALCLMLENKININVWNKLYRRHLFNGLRFPEGHVFEDQITTPVLIERAGRVSMLPQPLILYRQSRPGSITANVSEQNSLNWLFAKKSNEAFILKRIPAVFEQKKVERYEEGVLRGILLHYSRLLSLSDVSPETKRLFEKEIRVRAKNVSHCSPVTKAVYLLYRIEPRLCYSARCAYGAAIRALHRSRHLHG